MNTPTTTPETPRSVEEIKRDLESVFQAYRNLLRTKNVGKSSSPTNDVQFKKEADDLHLPRYAELVFELGKVMGASAALNETNRHELMIEWQNSWAGRKSKAIMHRLNREPRFVEALLELSLQQGSKGKPSKLESTQEIGQLIERQRGAANAVGEATNN